MERHSLFFRAFMSLAFGGSIAGYPGAAFSQERSDSDLSEGVREINCFPGGLYNSIQGCLNSIDLYQGELRRIKQLENPAIMADKIARGEYVPNMHELHTETLHLQRKLDKAYEVLRELRSLGAKAPSFGQ